MKGKPILVDLFCGAGGCTRGYQMAGFYVIGVDNRPQPRYIGDAFYQMDALEFVREYRGEVAVFSASPPCQEYSVMKHLSNGKHHPDLVDATRDLLQRTGKPWVIENVPGAPLRWPLMLCGSMFGLETSCGAQLRRHRLFESPLLLMAPGPCQHRRESIMVVGATARQPGKEKQKSRTITVTGATPQQNVERNTIRKTFSIAEARRAMGIDWMSMNGLNQAIPPAYTAWIGQQLLHHIQDWK